MADLKLARGNPEAQLWEELGGVNAGMLGVEGSAQHNQPMAHQLDRENGKLWFFTRNDTDLVNAVGSGGIAHYTFIGEDHDYHACMSGPIAQRLDREKLEKFWNPIVAAWFDGKEDPALTMLELTLRDAAIWASIENPILFGWEIAKANLTDKTADAGVRNHIRWT